MVTVDVVLSIAAKQLFYLYEGRPDKDQIIRDFSKIACTLDPAPPCKWIITDLNVDGLKIQDDQDAQVSRQYSCTISIQAGIEEMEALRGSWTMRVAMLLKRMSLTGPTQ